MQSCKHTDIYIIDLHTYICACLYRDTHLFTHGCMCLDMHIDTELQVVNVRRKALL